MKTYIRQLTNGFVEKARDYFDKMIAEMEAGKDAKNKTQ
jgi:hypothetical protein